MNTPTSTPLSNVIEGTTRIGPYLISKKLGAGAMGEVFLGTDDGGREAAIKLMAPKFAGSADFVERFHREISLITGLDHPHIAHALGSGDHEGRPYLAMEYVRGPALDQVLKRQGALPEALALRMIVQIAKGLEHVHHKAGLIHRDIKPANILIAKPEADPFAAVDLDETDIPKLIDFGLAKSVSSETESMTMTGAVMGTPYYMAPEQIRGEKDIDIHADIYALGATLYHLLVGKYPYPEASPGLVMSAHLNKPVPDPGLVVPSLGRATRDLVMTAMAKKPGERFLSYRALILACERALKALVGTEPRSATRSRRVGSEGVAASAGQGQGGAPGAAVVGGGSGAHRRSTHAYTANTAVRHASSSALAPRPPVREQTAAPARQATTQRSTDQRASDMPRALVDSQGGTPTPLTMPVQTMPGPASQASRHISSSAVDAADVPQEVRASGLSAQLVEQLHWIVLGVAVVVAVLVYALV